MLLDGKWLRVVRLYLEISVKDIADDLRLTPQTIYNLERGIHVKPSTHLFYERTLLGLLDENDKEMWKVLREARKGEL